MKRISMLFIVGALAMGCGADASTGSTVVDAGNRSDTATGGGSDTGTSNPGTDAGTTTGTDSGTPTTDRGNPTTTDAGASTGGRCGQAVVDAVCMCRDDQACQNRVVSAASAACQQCLGQAPAMCCPTQYQAFQSCAQRNMCTDIACAQRACGTEYNAVQTCFNMAQQNDTACQDALAVCFGEFPFTCTGG